MTRAMETMAVVVNSSGQRYESRKRVAAATRLDTSAGDARVEAAEAKRERKAAKRRRDAALAALGQREARLWWESWVARDYVKAVEAGSIREQMCAIRRGAHGGT